MTVRLAELKPVFVFPNVDMAVAAILKFFFQQLNSCRCTLNVYMAPIVKVLKADLVRLISAQLFYLD